MSAQQRCLVSCNDCHNEDGSRWKIVDAESEDGKWYKELRSGQNLFPNLQGSRAKGCGVRNEFGNEFSNGIGNEFGNENGEELGNELSNLKNGCFNKFPKNCQNQIPLACTLVNIKNPTTPFVIPTSPATSPTILQNWQTDTVIDVLGSFNQTTGVYTVPESGDYKLALILNYYTTSQSNLSSSETVANTPTAYFFDLTNGTALFTSLFSLKVTPALLVSLPSTGQVILSGYVTLQKDQQIVVVVASNGATSSSSPFTYYFYPNSSVPGPAFDTDLEILKVRNTPSVLIQCNNNATGEQD